MGLGNHKRKMSISLSITLIFPHTMANLVQTHGRERKSTTAYDMHPVTLNPRVRNAARVSMSEVPLIGKDTSSFLSVYCMLFSLIWGPLNIKISEFPDISPDLYLRFYLLQMNGAAGLPFIKLHHCWV